MRHIAIAFISTALIFAFNACSKGEADSGVIESSDKGYALNVETKKVCEIYDTCTYTNTGFTLLPTYTCTEKTYKASEHIEIDIKYFKGNDCLTTREDYDDMPVKCKPGHKAPCTELLQGPGELAIEEIGI